MVLALLEEAHGRGKENVFTLVLVVLKQTAVNALFTEDPEKLIEEKMYKPAESRDLTNI